MCLDSETRNARRGDSDSSWDVHSERQGCLDSETVRQGMGGGGGWNYFDGTLNIKRHGYV